MRISYLAVFLLFYNTVKATNYYFSSISGNDYRTATEAKNAATPWKTLSKLNSYFSYLQPGDSVLFKRGETFYGSIAISKSGTPTLPIVISAYGYGSRPVVSGLTMLDNWVSVGNGIYESYNALLGSKINMFILNGSAKAMGRYPNSNAANNGYLTIESHVGNTSIYDPQLAVTPNWTGGEVVIRKDHFIIDRNLVTDHSGNTITYTSGSWYPAIDQYGYFFQNNIQTLDQLGEWYYDPATKKMSVYFGADLPLSYDIAVSTVDDLVTDAWNVRYVVIDNITFTGANQSAFKIEYAQNTTVKNCDILFSGIEGFTLSNSNNFTIENNNISNSNNCGINLSSNNTNTTIRNNIISNTCQFPGMGLSGDGMGNGISGGGKGTLIEFNQVLNSGYNGIAFNGDSITIQNNYISNYCSIKDDGGGIYTYTGNGTMSYKGRKIIGNIVLNGIGAREGTADIDYWPANGIFLDNKSSGVEVKDNTVAYSPNYGIFAANAHDIIIDNNTVLYNKFQLSVSKDNSTTTVKNLEVVNNIFFTNLSTGVLSSIRSVKNDIDSFGRFDSNYYCSPLSQGLVIHSKATTNLGANESYFDVNGWQLKYKKDEAAKECPVKITPYVVNSLTSSNKVLNGSFTTGITGVSCGTGNGNCLPSWENTGQLDGGYLKVAFSATTKTSPRTVIAIKVGAVSSARNYILRYSLRGTSENVSVGVFLRQTASLYSTLSPTQYRKLSTTKSDNEILISSPATETDASLVFVVYDQGETYYFDNIALYEADVSITNPDNYFRFEYNANRYNKDITLDKNYVDVRNNKYSGTISLQPYSSLILIKDTISPKLAMRYSTTNDELFTEQEARRNSLTGNEKVQVKIGPNPAINQLTISINGFQKNKDLFFSVLSVSGVRMKTITSNTSTPVTKLDISSLGSGAYILKSTSGNKTVFNTFIKQ